MRTNPDTAKNIVIAVIVSIFILVMLTGCFGTTSTLAPSQVKVYTIGGDVHADVIGSENTEGGTFRVERNKDGTVTLEYIDKGSQWFVDPNFTGENWIMYAGIAGIVLGIGMFFFGITAQIAPWVIAGSVALIVLGSWLKTSYAPFVTTAFIIIGLAYALYRNRKALVNVVKAVNDDEQVKAKVYSSTDHNDDNIINKIK